MPETTARPDADRDRRPLSQRSEEEREHVIKKRAKQRTSRLLHFAAEDIDAVPAGLITPLRKSEFKALTEEQRVEIIRREVMVTVRAEVAATVERERRRHKEKSQPTSNMIEQQDAHENAVVPHVARAAVAPRWFVICSCGRCDTLVPVAGPKARIAFAPGHEPRGKKSKAQPEPDYADFY